MLLFVKTLRELQRLIGSKAEALIHILLQRGEVIKLRRIRLLVFFSNRLYHQFLPCHLRKDLCSLGLIVKLPAGVFKQCLATDRVHLPEILRLKKLHVQVTIHNHRENRRLHPPETEQQVTPAIFDRKEARGIQPHHPVGLTTALRRVIESIIVSARH